MGQCKGSRHRESLLRNRLAQRLSRLAGSLVVLLESIDEGTEKEAAREIRAALDVDLTDAAHS